MILIAIGIRGAAIIVLVWLVCTTLLCAAWGFMRHGEKLYAEQHRKIARQYEKQSEDWAERAWTASTSVARRRCAENARQCRVEADFWNRRADAWENGEP